MPSDIPDPSSTANAFRKCASYLPRSLDPVPCSLPTPSHHLRRFHPHPRQTPHQLPLASPPPRPAAAPFAPGPPHSKCGAADRSSKNPAPAGTRVWPDTPAPPSGCTGRAAASSSLPAARPPRCRHSLRGRDTARHRRPRAPQERPQPSFRLCERYCAPGPPHIANMDRFPPQSSRHP